MIVFDISDKLCLRYLQLGLKNSASLHRRDNQDYENG